MNLKKVVYFHTGRSGFILILSSPQWSKRENQQLTKWQWWIDSRLHFFRTERVQTMLTDGYWPNFLNILQFEYGFMSAGLKFRPLSLLSFFLFPFAIWFQTNFSHHFLNERNYTNFRVIYFSYIFKHARIKIIILNSTLWVQTNFVTNWLAGSKFPFSQYPIMRGGGIFLMPVFLFV